MRTWHDFLQEFYNTGQSLETFEGCPLRFYRRYYEGLRWDRPLDSRERASMERGTDFHMLARRYFLGVDCGLAEGARDHDLLAGWLKSLKDGFPLREDAFYLPEHKLRYEDRDIKLEANIDLVILYNEKAEIWDWKTHAGDTAKGPSQRGRLEKSLQTAVYLYTLKERSAAVFGRKYDFTDICMYYWQPEPAQILARIPYSPLLHEEFGGRLRQLVKSMEAFDRRSFDKSLYAKRCKYCEFAWSCGAGGDSVSKT
jgi:hypothetical protein